MQRVFLRDWADAVDQPKPDFPDDEQQRHVLRAREGIASDPAQWYLKLFPDLSANLGERVTITFRASNNALAGRSTHS